MGAAYKPGPKNLITDVAGLSVGHAENTQIKTGTTVLVGETPFIASVHVMGGAPGSRETDLLAPDKTVDQIDALVLSGGSAFGLEACSGVMDGLREQGRGFAVGPIRVPIVPGAIIFDLINGGNKNWQKNPYYDLGRSALNAAGDTFAIGSVGAGIGALTATLKGGLGSASLELDTGYTVGALVVANPLGSVTTSDNRHFWAAPFEIGDEFGGRGIGPSLSLARQTSPKERAMQLANAEMSNTTIAIVATDAPLSKAQCHRLAVNAQDGIARGILPAHTPLDGDLVFGVSSARGHPVTHESFRDLGFAAALCLSRAIARGVYAATPHENDLLPCFRVFKPSHG